LPWVTTTGIPLDEQKSLIFMATTVDVATPVPHITRTFLLIYHPIISTFGKSGYFKCIARFPKYH
jgi:hypothetical protein